MTAAPCFQLGLDDLSDIRILDRTFPGGRPTPSGKHHKWDKLFIRVKPAHPRKD
jgi:hypothetical protein